MQTYIERYNEQSFDWLTWRNGSVLTIFYIRHRYDQIILNTGKIRQYAVSYCESDNIPCRPKVGYVAIMFDTQEANCGNWWTHFTRKEFAACFPEYSNDIKN